MGKILNKIFVLTVILMLVFSSLPESTALGADPVAVPGFEPYAVKLGAVRYRALKTDGDMGPAEVLLGVPDLSDGARRVSQNLVWAATNDIVFTYDEANDRLTSSVSNTNGNYTLVYPNFSAQVTALVFAGDSAAAQSALNFLNYLQLDLTLGSPEPAQVDFMNVQLDGFSLGDFLGVYSDVTPTLSWMVGGYNLSNGFTLTGTIVLANLTGNKHDLNKIDISFGYLDQVGPLVFDLAATPNPVTVPETFTVTARVDDRLTGGSDIISADYSLDNGVSWSPMAPQDGTWDSPNEVVTAPGIATVSLTPGSYTLCVRGTDSFNKTGEKTCTTLVVLPPDILGPLTSDVVVSPSSVVPGQSFDITAQVDDTSRGGSNVTSAEYTLDNGANWLPMVAQDGSFNSSIEMVTASAVAPGSAGQYDVCVHGTDKFGNTGPQYCHVLVVRPPDTVGPITTNISILPNPVDVGGSFVVTAHVDDTYTGGSNIASAEYRVGSGSWLPMNAADGGFDEVSEDVTASGTAPGTSGNYALCVRGTDTIPNTGTESCIQLYVSPPDDAGPITSQVIASPNPVVEGNSFEVTAFVDDSFTGGLSIASAEYTLDNWVHGYPMAAQDGAFDEVSEAVTASATAPTPDGLYNLCVRGKDSGNNTGLEACTVLIVQAPDTLGPLVSNVTATPNPLGAGESFVIEALVDDSLTGGSTIASAEYKLGSADWAPLNAKDGTYNGVSEPVSVSTSAPLLNGNYQLCVRGKDQHDNTGSQACILLFVTPPDTQGPLSLDIDAVPNPIVVGKPLAISGLINDSYTGNSTIASAQYTLDHGATWYAMNPVDGGFNQVSEQVSASTTAPASSGNYDLCLRGKDSKNNQGPQNCITLVVVLPDTLGPLVSGLLVSPNPVVVGEPLTLKALIDDTTTGNSLIKSAEYTADGTNWLPMNPQDGSFDEVSEQAIIVLNAPAQAGQYTLCVRGSDIHGNLAFQACTDYTAILPPPQLLYFPLILRQAGN